MSVLASKFDITRGYPNGALEEDFPIKKTGTTYETIPAGHLVVPEADAAGAAVISAGTTPDTSQTDNAPVWLVVEGNDDFSGDYVKKAHCLRLGSGLIWETDQFAAGTYAVSTPVSFSAGKIKVKGSNEQIIGYVVANEVTARGVLRIADTA
jgi:hypothetical protein